MESFAWRPVAVSVAIEHFSRYGHRYLGQVQYLFNRRYDMKAILQRLLRAACLTEPHSRVVIRAAEVGA